MNIPHTSIATTFSAVSLVLIFCAVFYPMIGGESSGGYFALSMLFVVQILIALVFRSSSAAFLQGDIARFTPDTSLKTGLISLIILAFLAQAALFVFGGVALHEPDRFRLS